MPTSIQKPFLALGDTHVISAAAAAPAAVQALVTPRFDAQSAGQYRVVNAGTTVVFLSHGPTAALAEASAVEPAEGVPSSAIPILPGTTVILQFPRDAFFSATAALASLLYITPGQGM